MPLPAIDFSVFADCASSHQLSLRSCLFLPLLFYRWLFPCFFFLPSSFVTATTLIEAHLQRPTQGARAGPAVPGARRGRRGGSARLGLERAGAEEKLRSSCSECLAAGSRGGESLNVDFCLGTTCQQKRRLKTRAGAIYRHPRRRGRGAALASHCSICSAHPTQAEFGITLTMCEFFFSASSPPTPPPPRPASHKIEQ